MDQFCLQKHPARSEGCFAGKIGRENPWLIKICNFPKKWLYTILSSYDMKMREFFTRESLFYLTVPRDVNKLNVSRR